MSRSIQSRASTATITGEAQPSGEQSTRVPSPTLDDIPAHLLAQASRGGQKRLVIAVDFGTTYSAVSYAAVNENEQPELLGTDRIASIHNYPGDSSTNHQDRMRDEVPTEVIYPRNSNFRNEEKWDGLRNIIAEDPQDSGDDDDHHRDDLANGHDEIQNGASESLRARTRVNTNVPVAVMDTEIEDGDEDEEMFDEADYEKPAQFFQWGYTVHEAQKFPNTHSDPKRQALSRFKLLLDESEKSNPIREQLKRPLGSLKRQGIIRGSLTVIADYLTCLLIHTKSELRSQGYDASWLVELVMCVPAIWTPKACRDMQAAFAMAVQQAHFEGLETTNNSIENLFIVSEPEAAAAYVLATDRSIKPHDTFVLIDAGGGTVDANTYTVSRTAPLTITKEVVHLTGSLCGSSYLNERFRKLLIAKLEEEHYLDQGEITRTGIVDSIVVKEFEHNHKRKFDYYDENNTTYKKFYVSDILRDNKAKGLSGGCLHVRPSVMRQVFKKCLDDVEAIMRNQIEAATKIGVQVDKVVLVGGFAQSLSLQHHLGRCLATMSQGTGHRIRLIPPDNQVTAVASGAVLRALNKEGGPSRFARSSYGILRTEPYNPKNELHKGLKPRYDKCDGLPEIRNTIYWVLKMGTPVSSVWNGKPLACIHNFMLPKYARMPLICQEVLYVSDNATESHYRRSHPNNKGAILVGEITTDFTFLRDQGLIQPTGPSLVEGKLVGTHHYRVEYVILIRVVDRDLKCYAIWNKQEIQCCRINISPAFFASTK